MNETYTVRVTTRVNGRLVRGSSPRRPSGQPRDSQKSKVYNSENVLRFHRLGTFKQTEAWIRRVMRTKFWREFVPPGMPEDGRYRSPSTIKVKDGRGTRIARGSRSRLNLPAWARTDVTVLHELAHALQTERPAHSWQFCAIYLQLIRRFMGKEEASALRAEYARRKVKHRKPRG